MGAAAFYCSLLYPAHAWESGPFFTSKNCATSPPPLFPRSLFCCSLLRCGSGPTACNNSSLEYIVLALWSSHNIECNSGDITACNHTWHNQRSSGNLIKHFVHTAYLTGQCHKKFALFLAAYEQAKTVLKRFLVLTKIFAKSMCPRIVVTTLTPCPQKKAHIPQSKKRWVIYH